MKLSLVVIFLILLSASVYAEELSFSAFREKFSPGDTLQLEISVIAKPEFPMESKNIKFRSSSENIRVAPFLTKLNDTLYFLSFDIPQGLSDGTYSVVIESILFKENGKLIEKSLKKDINVVYSEPILSISPAFFISGQQISLEVLDKKKTTEITIGSPRQLEHVYSSPQSIQEGKSRLFKFTQIDSDFAQLFINLSYEGSSYSIPVYNLKSAASSSSNETTIVPTTLSSSMEFKAPQLSIDRSIEKDTILEGPITLSNSGDSDITDVNLSLTGNLASIVSVYPTEINVLKAHESAEVIVSINKEQNPSEESYSGTLEAVSGSSKASYSINIKVLSEKSEVVPPTENTGTQGTSSESSDIQGYNNLLNLSATYEEKPPEKISSSLIITILTLLAGIVIYFFSKKKVEHKPFETLLRKK